MYIHRRDCLRNGVLALSTALLHARKSTAFEDRTDHDKFYTVEMRHGRWWFVTPEGKIEFSIGRNHIDPSALRYPENKHIWENKYGNSMQRWLQGAVAADLRAWGFNCFGWNQEVITRGPTNPFQSSSS